MQTARRVWTCAVPIDVELPEWDMLDQKSMEEVAARYRPTQTYSFDARSSGIGMYDDSVDLGETNGLTVARMLQAIRESDPEIRFLPGI